jgi:hypothetical protein
MVVSATIWGCERAELSLGSLQRRSRQNNEYPPSITNVSPV